MEVTKRKEVYLHPAVVLKLEGKAKRARMLLKPYMEEILINHAESDIVLTKTI